MEKKQSYEDYLEAILYIEQTNGYVRSIDVANVLNFSRASVSIAIKKMENDGYVMVDRKDFYIHLTDTGRKIGEKILHRHKVLTSFFIKLGVSKETASCDACKIEHDLSDETFAQFEKFLENK